MRDAKGVPVWDSLRDGVEFLRHYSHGIDMVQCTHAEAHRHERSSGAVACRVCKGDEFTTANFTRPVKMQVKLTASAREPMQATLF